MEFTALENTLVIIDNQEAIPKKERDTSSFYQSEKDAIIKNLIEEAGEQVYIYLERFGFIHNTNIILLSSIRHYLYGTKDLTDVKTVVNLKLMNHIPFKQYCLNSINHFLPVGGVFVGCLIDFKGNKNNTLNTSKFSKSEMLLLNSYVSKVYSLIPFIRWGYKIFNIRNIKFLTINKARSILEKNGFQVININEINGITYFVSIKISNVESKRFSLLNLFNNN